MIGPLLLFELVPHAQLQLQALPVTDQDDVVRIRRARAGFDGKAARDLRVDLRVQFFDPVLSPPPESPVRMLDAKLRWDRHDWAVLGAGLGKVPFSRSNLTQSHDLQLPERPFAVESSEQGGLVPERRLGATLEADLGMVGYHLGLFRGAEGHSDDEGEGYLVVARLELLPLGPIGRAESALDEGDPWFDWPRLALGGSFVYQDREHADRVAGQGDLWFKFYGFSLGGEVLAGETAVSDQPARDLLSAYGQAGLFIVPDLVEVVARHDWTDGGVSATPGGASLFLWKGRIKLQASHTHGDTPHGEDETIVHAGLRL